MYYWKVTTYDSGARTWERLKSLEFSGGLDSEGNWSDTVTVETSYGSLVTYPDPSEWAQYEPTPSAPPVASIPQMEPSELEQWLGTPSDPPLIQAPTKQPRNQIAEFAEGEVFETTAGLEDELRVKQEETLPRLYEEAAVTRKEAWKATRGIAPKGKPSDIYKAPEKAWKWHKAMRAHGAKLEEIRAVEFRVYHIKRMLGHTDAWFYAGDGWYLGPNGRATRSGPDVAPTVDPSR
jgi:hypothetical protein